MGQVGIAFPAKVQTFCAQKKNILSQSIWNQCKFRRRVLQSHCKFDMFFRRKVETNLVKAFIHGFITTLIAFVILTFVSFPRNPSVCKTLQGGAAGASGSHSIAPYSGMRGG
jgi:hypothetical protein